VTRERVTVRTPASEEELLARARGLAGRRLGEIAATLGMAVPADMRHHKGWQGHLVERALGASAASSDVPDFPRLGVELKTLPVDTSGAPCESTFVCTVPLGEVTDVRWEDSRVRRKLARVLWVPIEGERARPPAERRLGQALLWSPSAREEAELRFDWEELAGLIGRGALDAVTAHLGRHLQIRPKAAHGRVRRRALDDEGAMTETLPRGFYLRASFTAAILRAHYRVWSPP
jgi:DNA mismatch repair protein MutH